MPDRPIVVIGASAGGVEALVELVKQLPHRFPAALFVTVHFPASSVSLLPQILSRLDRLPAHHPLDAEPIRPGQIYIAPPDHHLMIQSGQVHLSRGPRENGHRPAIDTLFRSAAYAYGRQAIGVILTGTLDDGTAGLLAIKALGGLAIVQDPKEALFNGMPCSAIETVSVDWVLPLADIARLLVELVEQPTEQFIEQPIEKKYPEHQVDQNQDNQNQADQNKEAAVSHRSEPIPDESQQVARSKASLERGEQPGNASPLTCPDCGGVLWELREGSMVRFRCHVGHAYSINSLAAEQTQDVEKSLWTAVRALEEKAALSRRMAVHAQEQNREKSAEQFEERAIEAHQHATVIRQLILHQLNQQATLHSNRENGPENEN